MTERIRADLLLVQSGLLPSREKAQLAISEGLVLYQNECVKKPSRLFEKTDVLTLLRAPIPYVGRGGLKLEKALTAFAIDVKGKHCVDIGASTGGFTDCLLQNGAAFVYAVDVGTGQLADSLRADPRVACMENTDIRTADPRLFGDSVGFISADVSFISLSHILPVLQKIADRDCDAVLLVKPQFETGGEGLNKKGVVTSQKLHVRVLQTIVGGAAENGFSALHLTHSPVTGQEGNIEYLLHLKQEAAEKTVDIDDIVSKAFSSLRK